MLLVLARLTEAEGVGVVALLWPGVVGALGLWGVALMVAKPRALSAPAVVLPSTMPGRGEPERREVLLDTALSLQGVR